MIHLFVHRIVAVRPLLWACILIAFRLCLTSRWLVHCLVPMELVCSVSDEATRCTSTITKTIEHYEIIHPSFWKSPSWLLTASSVETPHVPYQLEIDTLRHQSNIDNLFLKNGFKRDVVVRILDANTIKLQKGGIVSLAGIRTPNSSSSALSWPECFTYSPMYKIKQLLVSNKNNNNNDNVFYKIIPSNTSGSNRQSAIVVRSRDGLIINQELVFQGFAIPKKVSKASNSDAVNDLISLETLTKLREQAEKSKLGLFQQCNTNKNNFLTSPSNSKYYSTAPQAEFESIEWTVETKWGIDGGKPVLRKRMDDESKEKPKNPGDIKGCSDFPAYEDALKYYETYFPYYGDVAKLDRDNDGIPCPGLPHTNNPDRYRMKIPKSPNER